MKYVLIGDIIGSRKLENRAEIQTKIIDAAEKMTKKYRKFITDDIVVCRGDEIIALSDDLVVISKIVLEINSIDKNIKFRFGIGYGELIHNLSEGLGLYGPALDNAERAIAEAKSRNSNIYLNLNYKKTFEEHNYYTKK